MWGGLLQDGGEDEPLVHALNSVMSASSVSEVVMVLKPLEISNHTLDRLNSPLLDQLYQACGLCDAETSPEVLCCIHDFAEALAFLASKSPFTANEVRRYVSIAIVGNSYRVLEWLLANHQTPIDELWWTDDELYAAGKHGYTHVIQTLLKYGAMDDAGHAFNAACEYGQTEVVRLLLLHADNMWCRRFVFGGAGLAARRGYVAILELCEQRCPSPPPYLYNSALLGNQLDIIRAMVARQRPSSHLLTWVYESAKDLDLLDIASFVKTIADSES